MIMSTDEFLKGSSLEVLIPEVTGAKFEQLLKDGTKDIDDIKSTAGHRRLLYFDESIIAYIVLRTLDQDEASLKDYFSRLVVSLDAQAYGLPQPSNASYVSNESSPSRTEDILWSGGIDTSQNPIIVTQGKGKSAGHLLAIWRHALTLSRPRMRLQSPTVVFKPTARLQPSREDGSNRPEDPFLPSGIPTIANLLESLKNDPAVHGSKPRLSAARLTRISPDASDENVVDLTVKSSAQERFRALPAISTRVRYTRANNRVGKPSIIASLDIETAPFSNEIIKLTAVDMELSDGFTNDLGKALLPLLPLNCQPKDNPVFLFRLTPNEISSKGSKQTLGRTVLVTVHATVLVSSICQPKIEMRWKTGVDFSTALNPNYGAPGQSMQRQRRPNNLSRTLSNPSLSSIPISSLEPGSTPVSTQQQQRAVSVSDFGISITVKAPKNVQVGQTFPWDILIVNRSSKLRQLSLSVLPIQSKESTTDHASKISSIPADYRQLGDTADAAIDENTLYGMQRTGNVDTGQVIGLSTDVRIGTMNPSSCMDAQLILLPLTRGYLQLEAVRLTDMVSNESVDLKDLPDIFAEDPSDA